MMIILIGDYFITSQVFNLVFRKDFWDCYQKQQRKDWPIAFAKTSGIVTRDRENNWQYLTGATPVTIPETIAGQISSPIKFPSRF